MFIEILTKPGDSKPTKFDTAAEAWTFFKDFVKQHGEAVIRKDVSGLKSPLKPSSLQSMASVERKAGIAPPVAVAAPTTLKKPLPPPDGRSEWSPESLAAGSPVRTDGLDHVRAALAQEFPSMSRMAYWVDETRIQLILRQNGVNYGTVVVDKKWGDGAGAVSVLRQMVDSYGNAKMPLKKS